MTRSSVSKVSCSIRSRILARFGATLLCLAIQGPLAADGVMITEFVAKNVSTLLLHLVDDGALEVDLEDAITQSTLVSRNGEVVHPRVRDLLAKLRLQTGAQPR